MQWIYSKHRIRKFLEKWEFVSDKVMGGISEGKFEILKDKK